MPQRGIIASDPSQAALAQQFAAGDLHSRPMPKQERARLRVGQIMAAGVRVLETHAPGDLSANLVAEAADVPVSSFYRYFPSVDDLTIELYLQAADTLRDAIETVSKSPAEWRDRLAEALKLIARFLTEHPYYRGLLVRIAAARGPQTLAHDHNEALLRFFTDRWRAGLDGFSGEDPDIVAGTTIQIALALEELMLAQPSPDLEDAYFREGRRALESYLSLYLSDGPTAPSTGDI